MGRACEEAASPAAPGRDSRDLAEIWPRSGLHRRQREEADAGDEGARDGGHVPARPRVEAVDTARKSGAQQQEGGRDHARNHARRNQPGRRGLCCDPRDEQRCEQPGERGDGDEDASDGGGELGGEVCGGGVEGNENDGGRPDSGRQSLPMRLGASPPSAAPTRHTSTITMPSAAVRPETFRMEMRWCLWSCVWWEKRGVTGVAVGVRVVYCVCRVPCVCVVWLCVRVCR